MNNKKTSAEFDLVVHATHEAGLKLGGIGAVLNGLLSAPTYLEKVKRTILVGPMNTNDRVEMERLTAPRNKLEILYSSFHDVNGISGRLSRAFRRIEDSNNVRLLYGKRAFGTAQHEVILIDATAAFPDRINAFKGKLYERFGITSDRYESSPEYNLYVNAAECSYRALRAVAGSEPHPQRFIVAHEFMGLPLVFAAMLQDPGMYHTVFYAHEVATVRPLVEKSPGHDTMFYNVLQRAMDEGLYMEDVFGDQSSFFKHALIRTAPRCDGIFAVGDRIVDELHFLGPKFAKADIDLVYNGVPSFQIKLKDKLASKAKLQQYARNLLGYLPDYVFTHVTRLIPSKGLWRDIRVLEHLDGELAKQKKTAILFVLSTIIPAGRPAEDIFRMEEEYGWPVVHREGEPDLVSYEIPFYHAIEAFNQQSKACKIVLVNQFGWSRDRCGQRMPKDMEFMDIRKGSDLEFGQSIYEPFGIAQVEPLSFGALCVVSTACGCVGFLKRATEGKLPPNVIVGDYIGAAPEGDYLQALTIGQAERDRIEDDEAGRVARQIAERLPQDNKAMRKLLKDGYALGQRMSWEVVARDYLVPGLRRAAGRPHAVPMVRAPRRPSEMRILVMILSGGEGTRLSILSRKRAKPAVPFAGKYRIIDFTLSNCVNSGIYRVGILTQYRPHSLNDHIRRGRPWDLDRMTGGVTLLQPYLGRRASDWYRGTADAIHQNLNFVIRQKPDVVLILSGDHIYKMNYMPFIEYHERKGADMTVATINVRPEDAHRFGILVVDKDGRVVEFQEKPARPKGTLASMGVYVFNIEVLAERLDEDALLPDSTHDFGKDILPRMVEHGDRVFAYPFNDYWVDVGTVHAYWEAHMDLLAEEPPLDLQDRRWVIHTRSEERPPVNIRTGATVAHSLISDGCIIEGTVEYSVLSPGVRVCPGAVVRHSIVMTDAVIEEMATVDHAILDKNVVIGKRSQVGVGRNHTPNETRPDLNTGLTLIGKNTRLPPGMKVGRNCLIGSDLLERDFHTKTLASGKTVGDIHSSH